jgi:hypothetical protein
MPVEKLTQTGDAIKETFHFDHADQTFTVTQTQDDTPVREYVAQQRLNGAKYVEGMGYEIATLPEALCVAYGVERGLPNGWYFKPEYNDELRTLIALAPVFNPHGKSM